MKTEHEKLKEIADLIKYEDILFIYHNNVFYKNGYNNVIADVREIIFTTEFMEKYMKYVEGKGIVAPSKYKVFLIDLHKNLDDPVAFIYNLLELGNQLIN